MRVNVRRDQDGQIAIVLALDEAEQLSNTITAAEIHARPEASRFAAVLQVALTQAGIGAHSHDER